MERLSTGRKKASWRDAPFIPSHFNAVFLPLCPLTLYTLPNGSWDFVLLRSYILLNFLRLPFLFAPKMHHSSIGFERKAFHQCEAPLQWSVNLAHLHNNEVLIKSYTHSQHWPCRISCSRPSRAEAKRHLFECAKWPEVSRDFVLPGMRRFSEQTKTKKRGQRGNSRKYFVCSVRQTFVVCVQCGQIYYEWRERPTPMGANLSFSWNVTERKFYNALLLSVEFL